MEQRVKVLMCCSDLDSVKGGMVTVVRNYLQYDWKNCDLLYIPTHIEGNKIEKILYFAAAFLKITVLLIWRRADIVHLHMAERGSFFRKAYVVRLCRLFRVPVIIHHHGAEFDDFYDSMTQRQRAYVKRILESADCNLVLSDFLKDGMREKAPAARIEVLHNAVTAEREYSYHPAAARIVMLGRQGERKGSFDLLEAMAGMKNYLPADTELWMCGDGDVEAVKQRAKELGLEQYLKYCGWISKTEKAECLKYATMHILPSYREALPMSILETMAMGIPNISTNIASIPEVIHDGKTGFLIEPGDISALQNAICVLIENREKRESISRASYELIKNGFSLDVCIEQLENIYIEILDKRRSP